MKRVRIRGKTFHHTFRYVGGFLVHFYHNDLNQLLWLFGLLIAIKLYCLSAWDCCCRMSCLDIDDCIKIHFIIHSSAFLCCLVLMVAWLCQLSSQLHQCRLCKFINIGWYFIILFDQYYSIHILIFMLIILWDDIIKSDI